MKAGRPAHVLDADEAALVDALFDADATPADRFAAIERWPAADDAEADSRAMGAVFVGRVLDLGIVLPVVPAWLHELGGITETARVLLAALIEAADPVGRVKHPVRVLCERFDLRCRMSERLLADPVVDALAELRDARLLRGNGHAVILTRRHA